MRLVRLLLSQGAIGCMLAVVLVAGTLWEAGPLHTAESRVFAWIQRLSPRSPTRPRVVFAAIGEESLERMGPWPWPRAVVARGLSRLSASGARAIGLDLRYSRPELNPGLQEVRGIRAGMGSLSAGDRDGPLSAVSDLLAKAEANLDGDAALTRAIEVGRLALPVGFGEPPGASPDPVKIPSSYLVRGPATLTGWKARALRLLTPFPYVPWPAVPGRIELPYRGFLGDTAVLGHDAWFPDADGVVRWETLLAPAGKGLFPSLSLRLAALASVPPAAVRADGAEAGNRGVTLGDSHLPCDDHYRLLLDFQEAPERIEFARFLDGRTAANLVRDRVVLVGLAAKGYGEFYPVPGGGRVTGAELAALATENILGLRHLERPSWAWAVEAGFLIYLGLFLAFLAPGLGLRAGGTATLLFVGTWVGVGGYLGVLHGMWFKTLAPLLLGLSGFGLVAARRLAAAEESRGETAELNKMLGLSFQSQGQLDLAFEKFSRCPVRDRSVRELLYNLGLDFERKRMTNKAAAVYRHILKGGAFRDAEDRIRRFETPQGTLVLGAGGLPSDKPLVLDAGGAAPTLGRYEIAGELGQGAMGTVYLGRDPKINRHVAIKTLRLSQVSEAELAEVKRRFFREAQAAGKLNHPGIVTIYDAGEDHDLAYLAMEYLEGKNLTAHCARDDLLPVGEVLDLTAAMADALDYAHRHGVVHRDIKPANIMLLGDGQVKVTDFGIARVLADTATQTGIALGTPSYMSPEQVAGRKVDGRSDLFSLGVVLYELLSGERPFVGENLAALTYQITKGGYRPLREARRGLPACCSAIVDRLLVRAISRRVKSAAEVADQLRTCRRGLR